jgi:hypothetical protein
MRKWVVLFIVAATCFPALPAATEACGWRRCRPAPCYQYQLYYPVPPYQPCYPAPLYSPAVAPTAPPTRTVTIKGKTYQILPTSDRPAHEQEELEKKDSLLLKNSGIPPADVFNGTVRRIAKVIIFNGDPKAFDSVDALRVSLRNDRRRIASAAWRPAWTISTSGILWTISFHGCARSLNENAMPQQTSRLHAVRMASTPTMGPDVARGLESSMSVTSRQPGPTPKKSSEFMVFSTLASASSGPSGHTTYK